MRAYEEYKDSGYDWLGKIPAHWRCVKIREIFIERRNKVSDKDFPPLSVTKAGIVPQLETAAKSDDGDNRKRVNVGDFVINGRSDRKGSSGISPLEGSVSLINHVLIPRLGVNKAFLHYLLRSNFFIEEFYKNGRGIVADLWTTRYSDMKTIRLPLPPREEQDAIVRFLDAKCAKIDSLIKLKERQIALLNEKKQNIINQAVTRGLDPNAPMKDSGVDYIGMIPSHWQVILNHRLWEEKTRGYSTTETVLSLSQQDGVVPYEDMTERSLHTSSYDNWKLVFPGDLVVNRFKAHLGVFFSSAYRGIVTFHYGVFQFKMNGSTKYYEYLYHTPKFCRVYASLSNGMTVGLQNLSNSHFYSAYSVYPPVHEQKEIVDKIETINVIYRNKIKIIENEILILHEYKMKLISDVVTGKINIL